MSQSGGVMGRTMPPRPSQPGRSPGMTMALRDFQGGVARQSSPGPWLTTPTGSGSSATLIIGSNDHSADLMH